MDSWIYDVLLWGISAHIKFHFSFTPISKQRLLTKDLSTLSDSEMNPWPSDQWANSSTPLGAEIQMYDVVKVSPTSDDQVRLCPMILSSTVPVGPCHSGSLFFSTMQVQRVMSRQVFLVFPGLVSVAPPGAHRNSIVMLLLFFSPNRDSILCQCLLHVS